MEIIGEDVKLLVEVKRFPSRSLSGTELNEQIRLQLMEFKADLCRQAAHFFLLDENKQCVRVICAAGPYWSETEISCGDIPYTLARLSKTENKVRDKPLKWGRPRRIGSESSNTHFRRIRNGWLGVNN